MNRIAPPSIKVRPNHSLAKFIRERLLSPNEWDEFDQVAQASKPQCKTALIDGLPDQEWESPSEAYLRRRELEGLLLKQFKNEIGSGRWAVTAIPKRHYSRERIALELIENSKDVASSENRIDSFLSVEITEFSAADRYLAIKWFIEQVCAVVEPKRGVTKVEIQNLADRLLDFDVRDDSFKVAWADAKIPEGFRRPGR
ncbi:hypothetical protein [Erythrobacter alti]|uniref:hypothetical protein n=1 Tax=Erythrobacter alti TaxID=1896145 RepID=UPI0030F44C43